MQPDNTPNNGEQAPKDLHSNKSKDNIEYKAEEIVTKLVETQSHYEDNTPKGTPEATEVEIVSERITGKPLKAIAKEYNISETGVSDKLRKVLERANNPQAEVLKKGLKNSMFEVASLSVQELHERVTNEPERIPTPVLTIVSGVMTQRALEIDKLPAPQGEPDWGKLSETDNGQDIVPDDNIRLD